MRGLEVKVEEGVGNIPTLSTKTGVSILAVAQALPTPCERVRIVNMAALVILSALVQIQNRSGPAE